MEYLEKNFSVKFFRDNVDCTYNYLSRVSRDFNYMISSDNNKNYYVIISMLSKKEIRNAMVMPILFKFPIEIDFLELLD